MVNALSCLPLWFREGYAFFEAKEPRKVTEYTERESLEASGASNSSRSPCRAIVPSPWGEGQDEGEPLINTLCGRSDAVLFSWNATIDSDDFAGHRNSPWLANRGNNRRINHSVEHKRL